MKTSQDIVSCYPVNHMLLDLAWRRNLRLVGCRSYYEGHQSKEASKEFKTSFIGIIYKATWNAMKKKAFSQLLCLPAFLHLRMRPKVHRFSFAMRRRIRFLNAVAIQAGQKIPFNLRRKQIFVIFNDCQNMLKNFPSTEFSIGDWQTSKLVYFTTIFLDYNRIARLKVCLKVVLNLIGFQLAFNTKTKC